MGNQRYRVLRLPRNRAIRVVLVYEVELAKQMIGMRCWSNCDGSVAS